MVQTVFCLHRSFESRMLVDPPLPKFLYVGPPRSRGGNFHRRLLMPAP